MERKNHSVFTETYAGYSLKRSLESTTNNQAIDFQTTALWTDIRNHLPDQPSSFVFSPQTIKRAGYQAIVVRNAGRETTFELTKLTSIISDQQRRTITFFWSDENHDVLKSTYCLDKIDKLTLQRSPLETRIKHA
ncbi:hypothetical protein HYS93_01005 [Candidatus Daviesbacteria bacterium]|nr:hypothetical protein [Candidatus Daviesbacteria bacterium]